MRKLYSTLAVLAAAALALPGVAYAQADKLVVGMPTTPPNVVHMPVIVAKELGLYKKYGVDVDFVALDGGVKVYRAMLSGNIDVAMAPAALTAVGISKGSKVKAILASTDKFEASMVVRDNVKTMADLKGKRIGIQQPGGFADILSKNVLRAAKIDPKDVTSSPSRPKTCRRWSPIRSTPRSCMSSRKCWPRRRCRACTPSRACGTCSRTRSITSST